jgi:hypothetical protein
MVEHYIPPAPALAEVEGPLLYLHVRNTANLKHNWCGPRPTFPLPLPFFFDEVDIPKSLAISSRPDSHTHTHTTHGAYRNHAAFGGSGSGQFGNPKYFVVPTSGQPPLFEIAVEARSLTSDVSACVCVLLQLRLQTPQLRPPHPRPLPLTLPA